MGKNAGFINIEDDASVEAELAVRYLYQSMQNNPDGIVCFSESLRFDVLNNGLVYPFNLDVKMEDIPEPYFEDWKKGDKTK